MNLVHGRSRWSFWAWCLVSLLLVSRVSIARSFSAYRSLMLADQWFNTERALTADDLRGRLLLVDFWSYASASGQHVVADLKQLETEFGHELTVIGVHSAKFANEKEPDSVRDAILRYEISHPVANDRDFKVWEAFEVTAWPSLVLIDPSGDVLKRYSGQGHLAEIRQDITEFFAKHPKPPGTAALAALPLAPERAKEKPQLLRYPGSVLWTMHEGRPYLFIADSGHHRVLGLQLDGANLGQIHLQIGKEGEAGDADGDAATARFRSPQGLAYEGGTLFVADTGNNKVRAIDLRKRTVTTLAGTGQVSELRKGADLPAVATPLDSPWSVAVWPTKHQLVISQAGTHQLWSYDREKKTLSVLAGNGTESIDDGVYPENSLAQPSGLSAFGDKLYFVDSDTSSLRVLEGEKVSTLIGTGLFDFGFRDGVPGRALMQHPLAVYADKEGIFVADSFNHAIRRFDASTGKLETLGGSGHRGGPTSLPLAQATFAEPTGLSGTKGLLYVADTGNGLVRVIDLKEKRSEPLFIDDSVSTERSISAVRQPAEDLPRVVALPATEVSSQKTVAVHVELEPGWKLNPQAPSWLALFQVDAKGATLVKEFGRRDLGRARLKLPALVEGGTYRLQGTFYFCESRRNSLCVLRSYDQTLKADAAHDVSDLPIALQK